jgi:hypothetical protein
MADGLVTDTHSDNLAHADIDKEFNFVNKLPGPPVHRSSRGRRERPGKVSWECIGLKENT